MKKILKKMFPSMFTNHWYSYMVYKNGEYIGNINKIERIECNDGDIMSFQTINAEDI